MDEKNFQREIPKRLHPYSKYKLSVKALPNYAVTKRVRPEEKYLDAETSQGFNMNLIKRCLLTRFFFKVAICKGNRPGWLFSFKKTKYNLATSCRKRK